MAESHTGVNVANVLLEAIEEWKLPANPPIVTDNASNMTVAVKEAGLPLHIGCFAHTLNLACGKALKLGNVSKLLARVRRIVSYLVSIIQTYRPWTPRRTSGRIVYNKN